MRDNRTLDEIASQEFGLDFSEAAKPKKGTSLDDPQASRSEVEPSDPANPGEDTDVSLTNPLSPRGVEGEPSDPTNPGEAVDPTNPDGAKRGKEIEGSAVNPNTAAATANIPSQEGPENPGEEPKAPRKKQSEAEKAVVKEFIEFWKRSAKSLLEYSEHYGADFGVRIMAESVSDDIKRAADVYYDTVIKAGEEKYTKRALMWRASTWASPIDTEKVIMAAFEPKTRGGDYNEFDAKKVIAVIKKFPRMLFQFGREYSPCLYAKGSEDDIKAISVEMKKARADEIGQYGEPDGVVRIWWD